MAFVSSFTPSLLSRPATARHTSPTRGTRVVTMRDKSLSMPFMDAPEGLTPDMPGYAGFDPLGLAGAMDVKFLQEAELKHGRICMLAMLGLLAAEVAPFPFYADAPALVVDRHDWGVTQGAMGQILLWCSFFEIMTFPAFIGMVNGTSDREPGDFCFDPLKFSKDPAKKARFQINEIKNGRLAMVAVSGAIHHAIITKQNLFQQLFAGNVLPGLS